MYEGNWSCDDPDHRKRGLLHDPWVESRCCDSSGERRAEAAVGEHGQSDERFDAAEPEGSSHDQAQLLVQTLYPSIRQAVHERGVDARLVLADAPSELDEGGQLGP